jgi:predicted phosphoribosyltransferase/dienelactone hydrolase
MLFRDRREAGRYLAQELAPLASERPVVVALPRGGVPVAYEIARALSAPLDVLAVRKLGAPSNPEFGVGAVAEDGSAVLDERSARAVGLTHETLNALVAREAAELVRRVERYRGGREMVAAEGRTVILVDDGLATGLSDLAAVRALRARRPKQIVLAVPVGPADSVRMLATEADEVVCPHVPHDFGGVGRWYRDFSQVSDEEVVELLADARSADHSDEAPRTPAHGREVQIAVDDQRLTATLRVPAEPRGLVIFAHGSGSSRRSPRNVEVALGLGRAGFATLLMDLLTESEARARSNVFDTRLLADRLVAATRWAQADPELHQLPIGYFGASTGAAAALRAAARVGGAVSAVVSRGGRPDLADDELHLVGAPTLLIVGGRDWNVIELNDEAATSLRCPHQLAIVKGAGHLFEEPGALEAVSRLAVDWFERHLTDAVAVVDAA